MLLLMYSQRCDADTNGVEVCTQVLPLPDSLLLLPLLVLLLMLLSLLLLLLLPLLLSLLLLLMQQLCLSACHAWRQWRCCPHTFHCRTAGGQHLIAHCYGSMRGNACDAVHAYLVHSMLHCRLASIMKQSSAFRSGGGMKRRPEVITRYRCRQPKAPCITLNGWAGRSGRPKRCRGRAQRSCHRLLPHPSATQLSTWGQHQHTL